MMRTYTPGLRLKTKKNITKNDIIIMCNLLNGHCEYSNLCEFTPEGITEGGILFKFNDDFNKNWYKSVRLCVGGCWPWVNEHVMTEWSGNNDGILQINTNFTLFLKSFNGAPLFTLNELKIWEKCFNHIGIIRVGKYPSKKSLIV
jgi:hypothetical protein